MTTVAQTQMQPSGYPPQQQGYPPQQQGYPPQTGYPTQPQQTTTIQTQPQVIASGPPPSRYNKKAGLITGILHILAGGVLILLGIINIVLGSIHATVGWSIWGGICFYVVTGILGVVSKNQSKCVIIAYMVMCIISAVFAGSQMIYEAAAAGSTRYLTYCGCYSTGYPYYFYTCQSTCSRSKAIMAMHSLAAITALAEMIIAIVGSAYCCAGCCTSSTPTTTTQQTAVVTYAQPGVTSVSGGSYPPAAPPAYNQQGMPMQQQPGEETKY